MKITSIDIDLDRKPSSNTVFVHGMAPEDFDKWAPTMAVIRPRNEDRPYRTGIMNIGGLELTIFER